MQIQIKINTVYTAPLNGFSDGIVMRVGEKTGPFYYCNKKKHPNKITRLTRDILGSQICT